MSFFGYFRALGYAPVKKNAQISKGVACYLTFLITFFIAGISGNLYSLLFAFIASMLFLTCIIAGGCCDNTPNLVQMMPLSHKRKTLYRFLAPFWMFILIAAFLLAVFIVVGTVIAVIAAIAQSAGGAASDGTSEEEEVFYAMGVYGGIFSFLYIVFMYSCGMIAGFIKKNKYRNVFLLSVCGAIVISFVLMSVPRISRGGGLESPFVSACYESMALPWLCITIWGILAAAALGTAIYLGIKSSNPKKF